jgi:hypothetical protein
MIDRLRLLFRAMRAHPRLTLLAAFGLFALVDPRAALGLVLFLATVLAALAALTVVLTRAFGRPGLTWPKLAVLILGTRWAGRRDSG